MENRNMMNLSKLECQHTALKVQNNSDRLWENAALQADNKDYGLAISLMVMSTEELIKSMVLTFDSVGFELRKTASVQRFFKEHAIRHVTSFLLLVIYVFGSDLARLFKAYLVTPKKAIEWLTLINDQEWTNRFLTLYCSRKFRLLQKELDWFSKLERYRQNGFYYDYDNDPLSVTPTAYQIAFERLSKVRRIAILFIDTYRTIDPQNKEAFNQLLITVRAPKTREALGLLIKKVKRNKEESFDGLKEMFTQIMSTL